ncbi:MAG: ParB/RepB/Spo0J family partition protein [bacterium]|nr:ParB/RepB/Spo0J family partition protein [bacterium]
MNPEENRESKNGLSHSIFWIELEKIKPNPYQPRHEFDQAQLNDLAESIRQYGVLQPLVATRKEFKTEDGGLGVEYELIAGERRLRASKIAGISQVPVVIRTGEQSDLVKLELAIIENIQREDLNSVDRARAFKQLVDKFNFKHAEIAVKVGKSREYVSNTMRILDLPEEILEAVSAKKITEGHTRPLLMLIDRKEEQMTLFKEIMYKKLSVREAESIARKIAVEKVRKKDYGVDPEIIDLESKLTEKLGTRVAIEKREFGGRVTIDFFSKEDVHNLLSLITSGKIAAPADLAKFANGIASNAPTSENGAPIDDVPKAEKDMDDPDLYSLKNFSV